MTVFKLRSAVFSTFLFLHSFSAAAFTIQSSSDDGGPPPYINPKGETIDPQTLEYQPHEAFWVYRVFGLREQARADRAFAGSEIKKAYRRRMLMWHPDKYGSAVERREGIIHELEAGSYTVERRFSGIIHLTREEKLLHGGTEQAAEEEEHTSTTLPLDPAQAEVKREELERLDEALTLINKEVSQFGSLEKAIWLLQASYEMLLRDEDQLENYHRSPQAVEEELAGSGLLPEIGGHGSCGCCDGGCDAASQREGGSFHQFFHFDWKNIRVFDFGDFNFFAFPTEADLDEEEREGLEDYTVGDVGSSSTHLLAGVVVSHRTPRPAGFGCPAPYLVGPIR